MTSLRWLRELDALGEVEAKLGGNAGSMNQNVTRHMTHVAALPHSPVDVWSLLRLQGTHACPDHITLLPCDTDQTHCLCGAVSILATVRRWRDCKTKNWLIYVQRLRIERPETNVCRDQRHQSMEHYSFKMKGEFTDVETEALGKCTQNRQRFNHFFQHTGTLK